MAPWLTANIFTRRSLFLAFSLCAPLQFNEEHQVTAKASAAASSAWDKTKELNEKFQVTNKVGSGLKAGWSRARAAVQNASDNSSAAAGQQQQK